jgi:cupin 2 domain-containing protein
MNNIFDDVPENLDSEIIDSLLDSENIKIERIISKGHTSPETGWYDQANNEWVILLKGSAVLAFADNTTTKLRTGDYVNIPAHQKHKVSWTDPDTETIWLALHY